MSVQKSQRHHIHTASLHVEFEGIEQGLGLQDSLGRFFSDRVKPALERALDRLAEPDVTLVVDKLSLDCGILSEEDWEEEMLKSISDQLEAAIKKSHSNGSIAKTSSHQATESMLFFLERGYFPWNSPFSSPLEIENHLGPEMAFVPEIAGLIGRSSIYRDRLHRSFSLELRCRILEAILSRSSADIPLLLEYSKSIAGPHPSFFRRVFDTIIAHFEMLEKSHHSFLVELLGAFQPEEVQLFGEFLSRNWILLDRFKQAILAIMEEKRNGSVRQKVLDLMTVVEKAKIDFGDKSRTTEKPGAQDSSSDSGKIQPGKKPTISEDLIFQNSFKPKSSSPETRPTGLMDPKLSEPGTEIFVNNAGLVLLHPFIPALMEQLELVKSGNFKSVEGRMAAAQVLQYLVWGENTLSENHYPLNKILLGMSVHEGVDVNIPLQTAWGLECENLLTDVIGHWTVLKNTSTAGLRETFLHRDGRIKPVEKGWKLEVERKTVDILLGKLPWGIGIVKLPWMKEMLYVDWT